jgi:hypothetical protein
MLESGELARNIVNGLIGVIISLDPPTRCCGWNPCGCKSKDRFYTPMAKVAWQTGDSPGNITAIRANLLGPVVGDDDAPRRSS